MTISDTYYYLLENPDQRQLGLFGSEISYQTLSFDWQWYEKSREKPFGNEPDAYADWLSTGRQLGVEYALGKNTLLKIVLKAKDEVELIDQWVTHHSKIVGDHNLIIMDCGSEDPDYLKALNRYRHRLLILDYRKFFNFLHTTNANKAFFALLQKNCKYLTILDADEFLMGYEDGVLSTKNILSTLSHSNNPVFCGTWIENTSDLSTVDGMIDWSRPIEFFSSPEKLLTATVSGKSLVYSDFLFDIKHLGHNLHVAEVIHRISTESFGKFFVLHLKILGKEISGKRALKHLRTKNIVPDALTEINAIEEFLKAQLADNLIPPHIIRYANALLKPSTLPDIDPYSVSVEVDLKAPNSCSLNKDLSLLIDSFDFSKLHQDKIQQKPLPN